MNESFLKKSSLILFIIGFIALICLFLFQKPVFVSLGSSIPSDSIFVLNATIQELYVTPSGTMITFSYESWDSAFFQGNTSFLEVGSSVLIEGSKNNDFFSLDKITLI